MSSTVHSSYLQMCVAMMMLLNLDSPTQQRLGLCEAALALHELSDIGQSSRNLRLIRTQLFLPAAQGLLANAFKVVMGTHDGSRRSPHLQHGAVNLLCMAEPRERNQDACMLRHCVEHQLVLCTEAVREYAVCAAIVVFSLRVRMQQAARPSNTCEAYMLRSRPR